MDLVPIERVGDLGPTMIRSIGKPLDSTLQEPLHPQDTGAACPAPSDNVPAAGSTRHPARCGAPSTPRTRCASCVSFAPRRR